MDGLSRGPPNTAIPSGARYEEIEQESVFQSGLPILPGPRDKNHRGGRALRRTENRSPQMLPVSLRGTVVYSPTSLRTVSEVTQ